MRSSGTSAGSGSREVTQPSCQRRVACSAPPVGCVSLSSLNDWECLDVGAKLHAFLMVALPGHYLVVTNRPHGDSHRLRRYISPCARRSRGLCSWSSHVSIQPSLLAPSPLRDSTASPSLRCLRLASGKRFITLAANSLVRFSMSSGVQDSLVVRSAFSDSPFR